jgi:hypothetical protein
MRVSVRTITLWRTEVLDRPGALAEVLDALTAAGADLRVVAAWRPSGRRARAVIEVGPITGRALSEAAEGVGLTPSGSPTLLVSGANRRGLAHRVAAALADAGINLRFVTSMVVRGGYGAVFGFDSDDDAARAVPLIRRHVARGLPA